MHEIFLNHDTRASYGFGMPKASAGLLLYRIGEGGVEVLLAHPGGPFWRKKDQGAWTIPKGEILPGEDPEAAARREFQEELGFCPSGALLPLSTVRQKGGKTVQAFALEGDCDPDKCRSNSFELEWPPGSGTTQRFPEVDRVQFFGVSEAREKINPAQLALIEELTQALPGWKGDAK